MSDHSSVGSKKTKKKNCRYCKQPAHEFPNDGNSARSKSFLQSKKKGHPWELSGQTVAHKWIGKMYKWKYTETTIEPHHLIPISLMNQETNWKRKPTDTKVGLRNPSYGDVLYQFGYNINCKDNGAFYPNRTELACHLQVPLHKSGHPQDTLDYAISLVKPLMDKIKTGKYCFKYDQLEEDLKDASLRICKAINSFSFHYTIDVKTKKLGTETIKVMGKEKSVKKYKIEEAKPRNVASALTEDYADYKPGSVVGCGNIESLEEEKYKKCVDGRNHFPGATQLIPGQKSLPGGVVA